MSLRKKIGQKAVQIYNEKLKKHAKDPETYATEGDEQDDTNKKSRSKKKAKKDDKLKKPMWRDQHKTSRVSQKTLEQFALNLESKQTLSHIHNDDTYNTLNDKTVQMHKQSRKYTKFLVDPNLNPDNPHEMRFCSLPFDGLPSVYSKLRRSPEPVIMGSTSGRKMPVLQGMTGEATALKRSSVNDNSYDYDLEKTTHNSITRDIQFNKIGKRFGNNGIFGDAFDEKK